MSALTCAEGLIERFQTIEQLQTCIIGEPASIHVCPAIYITLQTLNIPLARQAPSRSTMNGNTYSYNCRLVLYWQDNAAAEAQLLGLVDEIPAAISADPRLGGRLASGIASISDGIAGYIDMGNVKYRVFDYTATVIEKG